MSNGSLERLWKLQTQINKLVLDGKRDPDAISQMLQEVLEGTQGQFKLERNEYGHVVLFITGRDLTGAEEIARLEAAGFYVDDNAKSCFLSTGEDSYDESQRLLDSSLFENIPTRVHRVALMPGGEIECDSGRTTEALLHRGMENYGYSRPLAGLIPRIRESLSNRAMEELGIWYAAALHKPIPSLNGKCVLRAHRSNDSGKGQWVDTFYADPHDHWDDKGSFVFLSS